MPNYVKNALTKFQHTLPNAPEDAPYEHTPPAYGAKVQYEMEHETGDILDKKVINVM